MTNKFTKLTALLIALLAAISFPACGGDADVGDDGQGENEHKTEIKLAHGNWACGTAKAYLVAGVLEEKMDYDVDMTMAELGMVFTDLANGNQDIFPGAWLPATHESYIEDHGDDLVNLGTVYQDARIGLVVPEYVDIDSIQDLQDNFDKFEGEIVGIDPGAGIMKATNEAIDTYDGLVDYNLLSSSDASMAAELESAIRDEDWVVATGWTPHWKFAEWELKFLEDPEGVYGEAERIDALTRQGLEAEEPEVVEFLENFYVDDEQLGEVMGMIDESEEEEMASALTWIEENEEVVEKWIP